MVLDDASALSKGTRVEVWVTPNGELPLSPFEFTPEEREEFEMWDRASAAAWAMIDEWEREEGAPSFEEAFQRRDKGQTP